jgi:hypothetical protein
MSKNDTILLRHLNLRTMLKAGLGEPSEAKLNWAKKQFDNIYEVGVSYADGGSHTWYAEIVDGKFNFICCAQYESIECMAIRLKIDWKEEGK